MATTTGKEEVEYESDPEEVKRSLAMRRREASDDEEGEGVADDDDKLRVNHMAEIHSDESDGQGGVAEYDDEEEELGVEDAVEEEDYDEEEEDIYEEEVDEGKGHVEGNEKTSKVKEMEGDGRGNRTDAMEGHAVDYIEEKENEPFAVPTAGAFYMHDDRFEDNAGGRHRRMRGGRKLWESNDGGKWGHDKFEELNMQERQYEEVVSQSRRSSRGRYRGRGRNRGQGRGYASGSSSKTFNSNGNQNQAPKVVTRGRGPRRYEAAMKHRNQAPSVQNKQSGHSLEKTSHGDSGGARTPMALAEDAAIQTKKNTFASSLSSASPPFYPSGSSNNLTQKEIQVGMEKLYINESTSTTGKNFASLKIPSSGSSLVNAAPSSQPRSQGRGTSVPGQVTCQPGLPQNQADRVSSPIQVLPVQEGIVQTHVQPSAQTPSQQSGEHSVIRSLPSSPPKTGSSKNSYAASEVESASETGALVANGKSSLQASGRGSLLCSETQVMGPSGNLSVGHGDQNFPAFLPVMQFGGQHSGGVGLPAFGMAFPGYVAQSQHGLGPSEMTWLPVLTGAGALGATYCSPYTDIDGSYHARPSGQPSSVGSSSKESNANKPDNELKPSQTPELTNNEFPHRQSNPNKQPRRYSEMSFGK